MTESIVIIEGSRTPCGGLMGDLSSLSASELGAISIEAALQHAKLAPEDIEEVIMGNVLSAGVGQGPARQASLKAGIPNVVGATTINKLCGSGLKAVMMAHDLILAKSAGIILAGGMESMSNAPYLLPKVRQGLRMGHGQCLDHMFLDGLQDAETEKLMGVFAQDVADEKSISRQQMDDFAIESLERAQTAGRKGWFKHEIAPVRIQTRKGELLIDEDEQPKKANVEKIPSLKPAFKKVDGTITAANASSISDGAAALVLMTESMAKARGLKPVARILGHAGHAQHPSEFTIAPCGAMARLFHKTNLSPKDIDLFEINEAFAMVSILPMLEFSIPRDRINIHGGACALGHPIGATGGRLLVTLINALKTHNKHRGLASLCIGGGEAAAMAIELID